MSAATARTPANDDAASVDRKIADAPAADARRQLDCMLPPPSELFPLMPPERADYYFELLVIAAIDDYGGQIGWWSNQLGPRGRRFLCRLARVPVELADQAWMLLAGSERARLIAAFLWINEWTLSIHPPLPLYRARSIDPV